MKNIREHTQQVRNPRDGFLCGTIDRGLYVFGKQAELFLDLDSNAKRNLDQFCNNINKGALPIILTNHQAHIDPVFLSPLVRYIRKNTDTPRFRLPVAQTLIDGKQGKTAQFLFNVFNPHLRMSGIETFGTIREQDKDQYTPEEIKAISDVGAKIIKEMDQKKEGFIIVPEGTLQGGRKREGDPTRVDGIQKVKDEGVVIYIARRLQQDMPTTIMSVAIDGSFRINDPTAKKAGEGVWRDMLRTDRKIKVHATTTQPITNQTIMDKIGISDHKSAGMHLVRNRNIFWELSLGEIAKHLPEDQQGVWGKQK